MRWKRLYEKFAENDFVFACDMGDLFCDDIPSWMIEAVNECADQLCKFLFLTKNPDRYMVECGNIAEGKRYHLGVTIESNRDYPAISKAPAQSERLKAMAQLDDYYPENPRFVSVEPVLDFDLDPFLNSLVKINAWGYAIGYDNHNHCLPEPPMEKTRLLIEGLRANGFTVFEKTIREAAKA